MHIFKALKRRYKRIHYGLDTLKEILLLCIDRPAEKFAGVKTNFSSKARVKRLANTFRDGDIYRVRDVKLPMMNEVDNNLFWRSIYGDTFGAYVYFNDDYSEGTVNCMMSCSERELTASLMTR